jgi:DNA-binding MarR family transcriptional regulator
VQWLRSHGAITRRLNADLVGEHGLTINAYEVLLHLARAPDRQLKPVDLAARLVLTPSGMTRLLASLEREGFVDRTSCPTDRRVSYAQLTDAGFEKLAGASGTHLDGVADQFTGRFSSAELATLASLLERLPGGERADVDCTVT